MVQVVGIKMGMLEVLVLDPNVWVKSNLGKILEEIIVHGVTNSIFLSFFFFFSSSFSKTGQS